MSSELNQVPGFLFFDHVAVSVKPGELEAHVRGLPGAGLSGGASRRRAGGDQVREVLLQVGDGPNLVQLLEPLTPESPVAKQIEKNGGRGGLAHVALRVADIQKAFDHLKRERLQDHRQGAAQGFARNHGLFRASQDHRNGRVRLPDRSGPGGQPCLKPKRAPRSQLEPDFPPVRQRLGSRHRQDLKGADYEKKLVWRTEEGLAVRPYYRARGSSTAEALPVRARRRPTRGRPTQEAEPSRPRRIRADLLHEAGANAVQELGYAHRRGRGAPGGADGGVDRWMTPRGQIEFVFAVGPSYFMEIAKLRAARLLWAQAVARFRPASARTPAACGFTRARRAATRASSTAYTNLLRVTTEALSAAVGGCDRLTVEPFGFDAHLALNVQRILRRKRTWTRWPTRPAARITSKR